jgi:ABC-type sugar transport system ATPase subunit
VTALLTASGIRATRARQEVLHEVDLSLEPGEITAMIGPNGAGKSTLLSVLAGLIAPTAGTIERHGRVAASLQTPALARRSVRSNLRLALRWWRCPRREWDQRTDQALRAINAEHLANRHAGTLSGGEARRVHLARALALRPDVLLLDEPFAGLDPNTRADLLYDASSALRGSGGTTLIVVHDRAEAWALADRVAIMLDGRIVQHGSPADVFERPATQEVAAFVGFSGSIVNSSMLHMYRPADVQLDPDGPLQATVSRAIPVEDGVRLELTLDAGRLIAVVPNPPPRVGDQVRVRVSDGVTVPGPTAT